LSLKSKELINMVKAVVDRGAGSHRPCVTSDSRNQTKAFKAHQKFLHGKSAFLDKRKKIDAQKRNQKAKALREYAKLCQREGIESDRVHLGPRDSTKSAHSDANKGSKEKKNSKVSPFLEAEKEARSNKQQREEAIRMAEEKRLQIKEKERLREVKKRERMKRTKKGQPILANTIKSILGKLTSSSTGSR
jgi:rRNA processing